MMHRAALITGSSRGIGKGIALALASAGIDIAVNSNEDGDEIAGTVAELRALGVNAAPIVADVGDIAGHEAMLDAAEAALGPITTLVNNAGVSALRRGDLLEVTVESYDRCQAVNTRGPFFLTQAWARRVLARERDPAVHHAVIFISSVNAEAASLNRGEYCISKTGLSMVAKLFACRLGADDIGSYEIQPGLIATEMTRSVQPIYRQRITEGLTITQRMGLPADIGDVALPLAMGQLAFCTGQALQADGGLMIPRF